MLAFLSSYYLLIKALHVIAVISWMAGLLYLPRLFVYHLEQGQSSAFAEIVKVMERRLYRIIMLPAMYASWLFGSMMVVANPDLFHQAWFHAKLLLVILMTAAHFLLGVYRSQLQHGICRKSPVFFRVLNEVPTLFMMGVVFLVILKPF